MDYLSFILPRLRWRCQSLVEMVNHRYQSLPNSNLNNILFYAEADGNNHENDNCLGTNQTSIIRLSINQMISRFLPRTGIYPALVKNDKIEHISYKSIFFDPKTGTLKDGYPVEGEYVHPIICDYYPMITKLFNEDCGFTPMNSDELATRGRLWKILNKATAELVSQFLKKLELEKLEVVCGDSISYDASDCLLTLVMSQSPDGISIIGGNLFAIMKIGYNTKYWLDFNMIDVLSEFHYKYFMPNEIFNWLNELEDTHGITGDHLLKFSQGLRLEDDYPSDILERVGKQALGLKGVLPRLGYKTV